MLQIYSKATINNCYFEANEADDNGGAIFVKMRSDLTVFYSILRRNKAQNNGGSILVQHSEAFLMSCSFSNESATSGFGGAICAENVANVTVRESSFYYCKAYYGGSVSIKLESVLKIQDSNIVGSFASTEGGGIHIFHHSFIIGYSLLVAGSVLPLGSGISYI